MLNRTNLTLTAHLDRLNLGLADRTDAVNVVVFGADVALAHPHLKPTTDPRRFGMRIRARAISPMIGGDPSWPGSHPSSPGGTGPVPVRPGVEVPVAELPPVPQEVVSTSSRDPQSGGLPRPYPRSRAAATSARSEVCRAGWRATTATWMTPTLPTAQAAAGG